MNLTLSPAELAFRDEVRAFVAQHFTPEAPYSGTSEDEVRWFAALQSRGWAAWKWPVAYGGPDWTATQRYIWEAETASVDAPPQAGSMGMSMLAPILFAYGSDAQRAKYLPGIISNTTIWCQGYSEPGSGSDLASLRTRAERQGGHYILNGEKIWTTGAHKADMMFGLVRTDPEARKHEGISFLLIDMKAPGVSIRPIISIDLRHSLNAVTFDNVKVPVEDRIGEENRGWTYAKGLLTHERTGLAWIARTRRRLALLKSHAGEIVHNGRSLLEDRVFAGRVSALEIELLALEVTELRTLAEVAAGEAPKAQSSILKKKGTELLQRLAELTLECAGPMALPYDIDVVMGRKTPVGPAWPQHDMADYLLGRSASIAGGTDEIQRDIIAKRVLGL